MKRAIIMMLLVCSATISANAKGKDSGPENVRSFFENLLDDSETNIVSYSVIRNPVTDELEQKKRIVLFTYKIASPDAHPENAYQAFVEDVMQVFTADEAKSYQLIHYGSGQSDFFSLEIREMDGSIDSSIRLRDRNNQEMWLMCTKNPENPMLRDAYAIVWTNSGYAVENRVHKSVIKGTVYMITSPNPEILKKRQPVMETGQSAADFGADATGSASNDSIDDEFGRWLNGYLSPVDRATFNQKFAVVAQDLETLAKMYSEVDKEFNRIFASNPLPGKWEIENNEEFDRISNQTKTFEKDLADAVDFAFEHDAPKEFGAWPVMEIVEKSFRFQFSIIENWYTLSGYLPESAKKCQKTAIEVWESLKNKISEALLQLE